VAAPTGGNLETNLAKAKGYLERFRAAPLGHFIAGKAERGAGREIFDNVSPVDARVINQVISGDEQDVNAAASAAEAAFPAWRAKTGDERRAILNKVANAIEARREEIAFVECMDTGQALRFMSGAALRAAENFRFFADRAPGAANGLALPADRSRGDHYAVEYAVHVVDVEDRARVGGWLHYCP
jgi:5-carboxymethyl-2-hydroxymuconic-semialdehyde dehydrogenase